MTCILHDAAYNIGDTVELLQDVEVTSGIFKKGTIVTITDKGHRGCSFTDEHGNTACEVSLLLFKKIHDATTVIGKEIYDDTGGSEPLYIQEVLFSNNEVALVKASFLSLDKMFNIAIDINKGRCVAVSENDPIHGFLYIDNDTCKRFKQQYYKQSLGN